MRQVIVTTVTSTTWPRPMDWRWREGGRPGRTKGKRWHEITTASTHLGRGSSCSGRLCCARSPRRLRRLFDRPGAVLVGAHDRAVDHRVLVVGLAGEVPEDPLPHAGLRPAAEAGVDLLPVAEPLRKIAPGDAGAVAVEHRLDEQAVVLRRLAHVPLAAGQQVPDPLPPVVAERVAAHRSVLLFGRPTLNRPHRRPIPQLRTRPSTTWALYRAGAGRAGGRNAGSRSSRARGAR